MKYINRKFSIKNQFKILINVRSLNFLGSTLLPLTPICMRTRLLILKKNDLKSSNNIMTFTLEKAIKTNYSNPTRIDAAPTQTTHLWRLNCF